MTTRKEREFLAARCVEMQEASEAGAAFFKAYPEAMLVEAWHEASRRYGVNASHQCHAFYLAVRAARERRDEWLKERTTT
jgi:hypothetical protein